MNKISLIMKIGLILMWSSVGVSHHNDFSDYEICMIEAEGYMVERIQEAEDVFETEVEECLEKYDDGSELSNCYDVSQDKLEDERENAKHAYGQKKWGCIKLFSGR